MPTDHNVVSKLSRKRILILNEIQNLIYSKGSSVLYKRNKGKRMVREYRKPRGICNEHESVILEYYNTFR